MNLVTNLGRAASPISILRERNFGLVWSSITLAGMASQMEMVVVVWYVLNLTDSPFLVGLTASARMGFNFLALFAVADCLSQLKPFTSDRWRRCAYG